MLDVLCDVELHKRDVHKGSSAVTKENRNDN